VQVSAAFSPAAAPQLPGRRGRPRRSARRWCAGRPRACHARPGLALVGEAARFERRNLPRTGAFFLVSDTPTGENFKSNLAPRSVPTPMLCARAPVPSTESASGRADAISPAPLAQLASGSSPLARPSRRSLFEEKTPIAALRPAGPHTRWALARSVPGRRRLPAGASAETGGTCFGSGGLIRLSWACHFNLR
jgi:hypothetical protein